MTSSLSKSSKSANQKPCTTGVLSTLHLFANSSLFQLLFSSLFSHSPAQNRRIFFFYVLGGQARGRGRQRVSPINRGRASHHCQEKNHQEKNDLKKEKRRKKAKIFDFFQHQKFSSSMRCFSTILITFCAASATPVDMLGDQACGKGRHCHTEDLRPRA